MGRCIKELERIYGIKHGGDRNQGENNSSCKTQSDLADELDIDVRTLQNYKLLAEMIPEMEELLDTGRCFEFLNEYYGFHQGNGSNQYKQKENNFTLPNGASDPTTQIELADSYGITKQTMNNYMRLANMIQELEELVDTGIVAPTTVLIRLFPYHTVKKSLDSPRLRTKNNESKQRKVADEYVRLCGYKVGDNQWSDQNGLTLSQIASQLGTSKTNLKRALRIERNLTESMNSSRRIHQQLLIQKTKSASVQN